MMVAYALWVVTIIALIIGQLAGSLHRSVVEERTASDRMELRSAAISGLAAYRLVLSEASPNAYSYLRDSFRIDPGLCTFRTSDTIWTICYSLLQEERGLHTDLTYGATDEESRLNILRSEAPALMRLPGVSEEMALGLEAYVQRSPALTPRTLEDLSAVPGWEGIDADRLHRLITFYGSGQVNVNTASAEVLRLLNVSERSLSKMIGFLAGPNGIRGDADDRYFKGLSEIDPRLREAGIDVRARSEWNLAIERGLLTVKSTHYRVRSRAVSRETGHQYEIDAVVRADTLATIVAWREHQPV